MLFQNRKEDVVERYDRRRLGDLRLGKFMSFVEVDDQLHATIRSRGISNCLERFEEVVELCASTLFGIRKLRLM